VANTKRTADAVACVISHYRRRAILASTCAASILVAASSANATTKYDGVWSVVLITDSGPCMHGEVRVRGEVINGTAHYTGAGITNFSFRVTSSGLVTATVSAGTTWGVGSGHASSGSSANGTWHSHMENAICSGTWRAQRE
jgi:hypothetical protein